MRPRKDTNLIYALFERALEQQQSDKARQKKSKKEQKRKNFEAAQQEVLKQQEFQTFIQKARQEKGKLPEMDFATETEEMKIVLENSAYPVQKTASAFAAFSSINPSFLFKIGVDTRFDPSNLDQELSASENIKELRNPDAFLQKSHVIDSNSVENAELIRWNITP